MQDKWTLTYGIHRGTTASRDHGDSESFDSASAALAALAEAKEYLASLGYEIWYAKLTAPGGAVTVLEQNLY